MTLFGKVRVKNIRDLSIKAKLSFVVALVVVGFTVFILFNNHVAQENTDRLNQVEGVLFPVLEKTSEIIFSLDKLPEIFSNAVVMQEEDLLEDAEEIKTEIIAGLNSLATIDGALQQKIGAMIVTFNRYFELANTLTIAMLEDEPDFSKMKNGPREMAAAYLLIKKDLLSFRNQQRMAFTNELLFAKEASNNLVKIGLILGVLLVILVSSALLFISRRISMNLNSTIASLQDLCSGSADLTQRLTENSKDETGQVVIRFNAFLDKMQDLIGQVVFAAKQVEGNAGQLSSVSQSTSENTKLQKIETDRLGGAMTDMLAQVETISQTIRESSEITESSNIEAISGKKTLDAAVNSMSKLKNQIDESSSIVASLQERVDSIGTVMVVIRSIAEKTNLLALNAAIEAARAGESGRGFAVVADEVRLLAGQTQDSTAEIQKIIESVQEGSNSAVKSMEVSGAQTTESVELIGRVSETLNSITASISQVYTMGENISTATQEQNAMAKEMHTNIETIQGIADKARTSSEVTDCASVELAKLAEALVALVGEFKVQEDVESVDYIENKGDNILF